MDIPARQPSISAETVTFLPQGGGVIKHVPNILIHVQQVQGSVICAERKSHMQDASNVELPGAYMSRLT